MEVRETMNMKNKNEITFDEYKAAASEILDGRELSGGYYGGDEGITMLMTERNFISFLHDCWEQDGHKFDAEVIDEAISEYWQGMMEDCL
jgi:hypothetical protein